MPWRRETPCLAREAELAWIDGAIVGAAEGAGSAGFVSGDAGMGKSRLLQEAVALGESAGALTVVVRTPVLSPSPFGVVAVLVGALRQTGALPDEHRLWHGPLTGLLPDSEDPPASWPETVVAERLRLVLAAMAEERSLMIVIDDLHRADAASLIVVDHLCAQVTRMPVVILAAVRPFPSTPATMLVDKAVKDSGASLLCLRPLERDEVARLVRSQRDATETAIDGVLAVTGGAPGAIADTVDLLGDPATDTAVASFVPSAVADAAAAGLTSLPSWAVPVAQACALLGGDGSEDVVAAVSGGEPADVVEALPLLRERGLLAPATMRAVVASMAPAARRAAAQRGIEVLRDPDGSHGPADERRLAALAHHAGDRALRAEYRLRALRAALRAGELREPTTVVCSPPSADDASDVPLLQARLELLAAAGRVREGIEVGTSLLRTLGTTAAAPDLVARTHLVIGSMLVSSTTPQLAAHHLAAAGRLLEQVDDASTREREALLRAQCRLGSPDIEDLEETCTGWGDPAAVVDALDLVAAHRAAVDPHRASSALTKQLTMAQRHGLPVAAVRARLHQAEMRAQATFDVHDLARERDGAAARGVVLAAAEGALALGITHLVCDRIPEATAQFDEAATAARRHGLGLLPVALAWTARAHLVGGRTDLVDGVLAEAEDLGGGHPHVTAAVLGEVRAVRALIAGDLADAALLLDVAAGAAGRSGRAAAWPFASLQGLVAVVGATTVPQPEPWTRLGRGCAAYGEAVVLGRAAKLAEASAAAERGDGFLFPAAWYHHLVRIIVAPDALRDGWGAPAEWLRAGNSFFAAAEQSGLAAHCRRGLAEAGLPVPRRRGTTTVPSRLAAIGITSREKDVLDLLREGLTRREIASRLVVSEDTVKTHVKRLLRKTGVASQVELLDLDADGRRASTARPVSELSAS